jgi:hypothetical protein
MGEAGGGSITRASERNLQVRIATEGKINGKEGNISSEEEDYDIDLERNVKMERSWVGRLYFAGEEMGERTERERLILKGKWQEGWGKTWEREWVE